MEFIINPVLFSTEQHFNQPDSNEIYDVIIIGGGPAGLTAAVYCMRKGHRTALLVNHVGGQVAETAGIENYLGYRYIDGMELVSKFREQVFQFGIDFEADIQVKAIEDGKIKKVRTEDGRSFQGRTLIIASGKQSKKLGVPGETEFVGHGVAYCSICDAPFYAGKKVVVVGGGNSGLGASLDLVKTAEHVILLHRYKKLKGDKILIDKLQNYTNFEIYPEHEVLEITGENKVTGVTALDKRTNETKNIETDGVFAEIGLEPNTGFVKGTLELNGFDEIVVDSYCRTNLSGIFAAGDVTSVPYKQIIIAGGEGAKAALAASEYILNLE